MVIWFIGKSGSGKTFFGQILYDKIKIKFPNTVFLDGDLLRSVISKDLGYTKEDRYISEERRCNLSKMLSDQGIHVIVSGLSNEKGLREWNKINIADYIEIYIKTNKRTLHYRDPKGLYQKYYKGEIENVVGEDIKFEEPIEPWMTIENNSTNNEADDIVDSIISNLTISGILR